uniref:Uncharacterized protein n=1 Tax=Leishmania guyanensis TaxID=5670 RepID=A0A1E1IQF0_LEIGU|nr:Hypothetical protein BN36_1009960 [Leishmania guyanensis]
MTLWPNDVIAAQQQKKTIHEIHTAAHEQRRSQTTLRKARMPFLAVYCSRGYLKSDVKVGKLEEKGGGD